MKILLIGECYSHNLGDPLLCTTVERTIKEQYPNASIVCFDISGNEGYLKQYDLAQRDWGCKICLGIINRFPKLFEHFTWYDAYKTDIERHMRVICSLKDLIRKEKKIDLAVFAGGSIFMDYFAGSIYIIVKYLQKKGIRMIFHACGMSSLSENSIKLIQSALNTKNIISISLRDSYSRFNELFRTTAAVSETYDTALGCDAYFKSSILKKAEFGIGIIDVPGTYEIQKKIIQTFLSTSFSWKIFTNGSEYDEIIALRILSELGINSQEQNRYLERRPLSPDELILNVTSFEKIISFRMHSLIVASAYGIPSVGFIWSPKVKALYRKLGHPYNAIPLDVDIDLDVIIPLLNSMKSINDISFACGQESKMVLLENIRLALERRE